MSIKHPFEEPIDILTTEYCRIEGWKWRIPYHEGLNEGITLALNSPEVLAMQDALNCNNQMTMWDKRNLALAAFEKLLEQVGK